jgi:hypothetical protein
MHCDQSVLPVIKSIKYHVFKSIGNVLVSSPVLNNCDRYMKYKEYWSHHHSLRYTWLTKNFIILI